MERVQIIALAVIVAALVLFGAGFLVDERAEDGADRLASGAVADDRTRPGARLWSSERESRRAGQPGRPGEVGEPERRRGHGGDDDSAAGDAEVVPGGRRAGGVVGSVDGEDDAVGVGRGGISDEMIAARAGTLPRAGGGGGPVGLPEEVPAEEQPPQQDDPGGVLLSIPLNGSIDPEQGGDPTKAVGVVVDGDAVVFTEEAEYTLPSGGHVDGDMGTIAFDIEPHWAGDDESNNSLLQIRDEHVWQNNLQIVKNYNSLRFIIIDDRGYETNVNVYIDDWQPNESHRVTATWGEALMALYVDGEQVGQATVPNELKFGSATPIHVGSDYPGSQYRGANGRISNLTIYGRTLPASEID